MVRVFPFNYLINKDIWLQLFFHYLAVTVIKLISILAMLSYLSYHYLFGIAQGNERNTVRKSQNSILDFILLMNEILELFSLKLDFKNFQFKQNLNKKFIQY